MCVWGGGVSELGHRASRLTPPPQLIASPSCASLKLPQACTVANCGACKKRKPTVCAKCSNGATPVKGKCDTPTG